VQVLVLITHASRLNDATEPFAVDSTDTKLADAAWETSIRRDPSYSSNSRRCKPFSHHDGVNLSVITML